MTAFGDKEQFQKLCHVLSKHMFLFGNIVTVKSIYGIKSGNAV